MGATPLARTTGAPAGMSFCAAGRRVTLIGQGSAPNELATFRLHFTITPSGAVTVDFERGDLICC